MARTWKVLTLRLRGLMRYREASTVTATICWPPSMTVALRLKVLLAVAAWACAADHGRTSRLASTAITIVRIRFM